MTTQRARIGLLPFINFIWLFFSIGLAITVLSSLLPAGLGSLIAAFVGVFSAYLSAFLTGKQISRRNEGLRPSFGQRAVFAFLAVVVVYGLAAFLVYSVLDVPTDVLSQGTNQSFEQFLPFLLIGAVIAFVLSWMAALLGLGAGTKPKADLQPA